MLVVVNQLAINRAAWMAVEEQVADVKIGNTSHIDFPDGLPCRKLTWYFWPRNHQRSYEQMSVYYDIPPGTTFSTVEQTAPCLPSEVEETFDN